MLSNVAFKLILRRYSPENDAALNAEITAHLGGFGIPPDRIVTNFVDVISPRGRRCRRRWGGERGVAVLSAAREHF